MSPLLARGHFKQTHGQPASHGQRLAVRGIGDRHYKTGVVLELPYNLAGRHIPKPDGAVAASHRQDFPFGREGGTLYIGAVFAKVANLLAGGHVPEVDQFVRGAGGEHLAVCREDQE